MLHAHYTKCCHRSVLLRNPTSFKGDIVVLWHILSEGFSATAWFIISLCLDIQSPRSMILDLLYSIHVENYSAVLSEDIWFFFFFLGMIVLIKKSQTECLRNRTESFMWMDSTKHLALGCFFLMSWWVKKKILSWVNSLKIFFLWCKLISK